MPAAQRWWGGLAVMSATVKDDPTPVRRDVASDEVEHRGLAGAVRPDHAERLAGGDVEAQILGHHQGTIGLGDTVEPHHGRHVLTCLPRARRGSAAAPEAPGL